MSFVLHHSMFELNRVAHSVLGNIVKARYDMLNLLLRHFRKSGIIVYAKYKNTSTGNIGKSTNMLGKSFFVIRQATFPIDFFQLLRNRL